MSYNSLSGSEELFIEEVKAAGKTFSVHCGDCGKFFSSRNIKNYDPNELDQNGDPFHYVCRDCAYDYDHGIHCTCCY
jgi:hypothetical protein